MQQNAFIPVNKGQAGQTGTGRPIAGIKGKAACFAAIICGYQSHPGQQTR